MLLANTVLVIGKGSGVDAMRHSLLPAWGQVRHVTADVVAPIAFEPGYVIGLAVIMCVSSSHLRDARGKRIGRLFDAEQFEVLPLQIDNDVCRSPRGVPRLF
jgi:hypothetical protein